MVSVKRTPGTRGWPGKCPSKTVLSIGTVEDTSIRLVSRSRLVTRSIISKYSRRIRISYPLEHRTQKWIAPLGPMLISNWRIFDAENRVHYSARCARLPAGSMGREPMRRSADGSPLRAGLNWPARRDDLSLGLLGGHECVNARHEVLQDEILLGRSLALVHFLRPLLQRQLDPEGLVDGKGDIEEGQGVDAQILNGMALGRDLLARDIGGL